MSLMIYDNDNKYSGEYVYSNDMFFTTAYKIPDNELVKKVLIEIDAAERVSDYTFIGRIKEHGALFSNNLSTGVKTCLNIIKYPDICFDVCECGNNVKTFILRHLHDGKIFWNRPIIAVAENFDCDIIYKNKHFSKVCDLIDFAVNGG